MKYSKEFKEKALKLSDEIGVKSASHQMGIQYYTLVDWRRERKAEMKALNNALTENELRRRIDELKHENEELRKANDVLRDALAFFAKDQKK